MADTIGTPAPARSRVEEILRSMLGAQSVQIAVLQAKLEERTAQIESLKAEMVGAMAELERLKARDRDRGVVE